MTDTILRGVHHAEHRGQIAGHLVERQEPVSVVVESVKGSLHLGVTAATRKDSQARGKLVEIHEAIAVCVHDIEQASHDGARTRPLGGGHRVIVDERFEAGVEGRTVEPALVGRATRENGEDFLNRVVLQLRQRPRLIEADGGGRIRGGLHHQVLRALHARALRPLQELLLGQLAVRVQIGLVEASVSCDVSQVVRTHVHLVLEQRVGLEQDAEHGLQVELHLGTVDVAVAVDVEQLERRQGLVVLGPAAQDSEARSQLSKVDHAVAILIEDGEQAFNDSVHPLRLAATLRLSEDPHGAGERFAREHTLVRRSLRKDLEYVADVVVAQGRQALHLVKRHPLRTIAGRKRHRRIDDGFLEPACSSGLVPVLELGQ
mmetsp:Transcript_89188/g.216326  ORF Transcript_89188/g.216326 Transcript_89188/m.216326 type:complete len:374 (-) Transcript_89188:1334-2455(-)